MSLPAKALQVLADLKRELLSREAPPPEPPKKEKKPTQVMRHARHRSEGFQRYCRQGRRW